ncbi:MAG: dihydroneopterin aldolase [Bacteroidia bacterium]|nr:dihydroneopterin aldolase [Bacteroidia bacterium]
MNSVKGKLHINNFRLWAYHGWFEEERQLGAEYQLDVEMNINLPGSGLELEDTVDYQQVIQTIKVTMAREFKLIEESSVAVLHALKSQFPQAENLSVTVTKLSIPINNLESTSFTVTA